MSTDIAVVGGGAWGTALANAAAAAGRSVALWLRDAEAARRLETARENARYLPGIPLHLRIRATAEPAEVVRKCLHILILRSYSRSVARSRIEANGGEDGARGRRQSWSRRLTRNRVRVVKHG